ncbi:MAG: RNase adapter RapZ [Methylotenera sp.]|uniref:RNase adapter RapZ n=1 Tax=Methylotenera sp. TaxID=2051956 RepID=UPI000D44DE09|nr:RNase adapter RapZ [Methylotenera sp.]PPC84454.1 MAG: RNase adapter RapZ [Methylotenera sp.]
MKQLIIVTGLSGSGKSIALRALEDSGYYCIDNLPATMLASIADHLDVDHKRIAISIDSRSVAIETLPLHIEQLKSKNIDVQVLFLESNVETLVKRFSETRRKHPLSKDAITLAESIALERDLLGGLGEGLGHVIDTSYLSANTLRGWVKDVVSIEHTGLTLLFTSFGFKHGIPLDADFVFDVRCLPNPHYDPVLRDLTGRDEEVQAFLKDHAMVSEMMHDIRNYVEKWLPCFVQDNRSYLTVAVGCTGGQHRSVYLVEMLSQYFKTTQKVLTRHRELK